MTAKEEIMRVLKQDILTLALKPGTILSETVLSERFRLSRTPLRDVLKQLSLESYIDVYPKKGNLVSYIDLESVEQIIYMRSVLEKDVIRSLAGKLTLSGELELKQILEQQKAAIPADNAHEIFLGWDDAFHRAIFKLAGREFLWSLIQQASVHYARYRRLHLMKTERLEGIREEHRQIIGFLAGRDLERLDVFMDHHLREDINSSYLQQNYASYIKDASQAGSPTKYRA